MSVGTQIQDPALAATHSGPTLMTAFAQHSNPAVHAILSLMAQQDGPLLQYGKETLAQNVPNYSTPGAGIVLS